MLSVDTTRPYEDDLRRLMVGIRSAITFFGLLLLAIVAFAGWSANRAATDTEAALLENAFNQSIANVLDGQKSVAWWDDAVSKITDEHIDLDFTDSNFGVFLTETYGHNEVYILNGKDQPLYVYTEEERRDPSAFEKRREDLKSLIFEVREGRTSNLRGRPDEFGQSQTNYKVLAGAVKLARWGGHIMSVDGRPAVVAAITIVPNVDLSLHRGVPNLLISVIYINDDFIAKISRALLMPELKLSAEPVRGGAIVSQSFVGDDGIQAGNLSWQTRRPGHVLLTVILPLVACGVFGAGILSNQMFKRLRRASEELAQREAKSRHASRHDALSGLPNRMHMLEKVEEWLAKGNLSPNGRRAIAAYVDIDKFKDINDTLGHETGDKLVRAVAERLRSRLRAGDFIARFGGDEFTILCLAEDEQGGKRLAERISAAFTEPFSIDGQSMRVKASIGIAMAPDHGTTTDELMRHADIALYDAKRQGRDRAIFFTADMARDVETRRAIEVDLRAAIERNELRLQYQPVVSCRTGEIVGAEALLRWRHPERGEVPPSTFIPIAEDTGFMATLGTWMLDRVARDTKRWPDLDIAVNLSPLQFRQTDLPKIMKGLVDTHGLVPQRFVLEITEGVLLEANASTTSTLDALQAMGFQTALDDFGTGYSSLVYLCNFKFNKIKIDRSFVANASSSETSRAIVQSVASLGRGLGMEIVAEGVETEYQAQLMSLFGCTELQGYYFSRPVEVEQLSALVEKFKPWQGPALSKPALIEHASGKSKASA